MIIQKINSITLAQNSLKTQENKFKNAKNQINTGGGALKTSKHTLQGIPRGYVNFKGKEESKELKLSADAQMLLVSAAEIAKKYKHDSIMPYHVIQAAIDQTLINMEYFDEETLASGSIESVSPLHKLANNYANKNVLTDSEDRKYFLDSVNLFEEDNKQYLDNLEANAEQTDLDLSNDLSKTLEDVMSNNVPEIDSYMLLGSAFNTLTTSGITYPAELLKDFMSMKLYKNSSEIKKNYMNLYDSKALEVWDKLALGSSLIVTYKDEAEANRMASSIVNTLDEIKHGNFNSENTLIYSISDQVNAGELLNEVDSVSEAIPDKRLLFMVNMNNLIINSIDDKSQNPGAFTPEIFALAEKAKGNVKFIFFEDQNLYFASKQEPAIKKGFSKFIPYSIPNIKSHEVNSYIKQNKNLLKDVKIPFTKEAREKAVLQAANIEGIYPDKAIDLMKRISEYYGDTKKKISAKDVDVFSKVARELFNTENNDTNIIYDTGKNLASLYGKETTKKDAEAIVRQIRNGNIGTKGIIIYSKDEEAGSGKNFVAQAIAGEAKVPFLELNTADFADRGVIEEGERLTPKMMMSKAFVDIKKAASENEYRTAIIYINNFEEFAFSGPYLAGYKQGLSQMLREMSKAEEENLNILVMGSTDEYYAEAIPTVVKGFHDSLAIDTPAFNKKSRKEILEHRIKDIKLPLAVKNKAEKEALINKLVKLTEYMSFVEIKSMIEKTEQVMLERNKTKASIGDFIESYLQLATGRTSRPQMPDYNKQATTSHECGHATNLEVMSDLFKRKGQPWHQSRTVNFITLDPRGNFLGAVFEGRTENTDYPFEAMFADLVCAYGGYSCEKMFFNMDGSSGISQDLAQASAAAKRGVELFGFGFNTGKISNAVKIASGKFNETVFDDMNIILTNAKIVSDLITEGYKGFNEWFTQKYSKLIGTDDCMVDGDDFRKVLQNWKKTLPKVKREELNIMDDMILDVIKYAKNGKIYYHTKKVI